jgi:hypothetical protein
MQTSNERGTNTAPMHRTQTRGMPGKFWSQHGEATLNWLALGLLLAAWNAADNEVGVGEMRRRPEALRGYGYVSVRAMARAEAINR